MGPFDEPNATIGRAWTILSKNLGGCGMPGLNLHGHPASNLNYNNICFRGNGEQAARRLEAVPRAKGLQARRERHEHFQRLEPEQCRLVPEHALPRLIKDWLTHFFSFGTSAATLLLDPTIARRRRKRDSAQRKTKRLLVEELEDAGMALLGHAPEGIEAGPGRSRAVRIVSEDGRRRDSVPALRTAAAVLARRPIPTPSPPLR